MPIEIVTSASEGAKIRVIGVGGGGCNAINNMVDRGLKGVELISINTDKQALDHTKSFIAIQIGKETTQGKGAGSVPEVGRKSAEESVEEIRENLKGSDMIFVTCGMGGGTGTGASPVVAKIGQELGALVVGIVTTPFSWEGPKRVNYANAGITELRQHIDALIVIPNQKLIEHSNKNLKFCEAYKQVDEILYNATKGIADIITDHGYVNVDFADVKTVMKGMGDALMGIGTARGENRAIEATENALNSPLLDGISIKGAQAALVNINVGEDLSLSELNDVLTKIQEYAGPDVNVIHGVVINPDQNDEIMVTVVATGFDKSAKSKESEKEAITVIETKPFGGLIDTKEKIKQIDIFAGMGFKVPGHQPRATIGTVSSFGSFGSTIASAPANSEQYNDYEAPAFVRRSQSLPDIQVDSFNRMPIIDKFSAEVSTKPFIGSESAKNEHNDKVIESIDSSKPAFLRRIMD